MSQPLFHPTTDAARTRQGDGPPLAGGALIAASVPQVVHLDSTHDEPRSGRNRAESEKLRLADRLQALMDALPAAVLVLDGSGRVQECNPAAEELLQSTLRGRLWRELIQELFLPQTAAGEALPLRSGRLVTLSTRPLGKEPGQVLMLQDVTDNHHLRSRLENMRRLADMGRMAASLAHQIRTPLSAALLYVSQLRSPRLAEEKRERFIGKALGSLKGLEKLITDMLLFVNGGKGRREAVRPQELLSALASELEATCLARGVRLSVEHGETLPPLLINRVLLKSALQNLVTNAIEAGADQVKIQACESAEWCELVVGDNGPGIAPELQQRIFEPFVTGRSEGTGLGLAVVRAVVHSMGGEVRLHSKPGQGAEFAIRLPKPLSEDAAMQQQG